MDELMPIPSTLPPLAAWMESLLGRPADQVTNDEDSVRWAWTLARPAFDAVRNALADKDDEQKVLPSWQIMRAGFGLRVPIGGTYILTVVIRDPERCFWALPPEEMKKDPEYLRCFCPVCDWVKPCKCKSRI